MMRNGFRTLRQALVFAIVAIAMASCNQSTDKAQEKSRDTDLSRANALMDRQDYSGAIEILNNLYASEPTEQVKMTLASAYAGRAGLKVGDYWGFVVGYQALLKGAGTNKLTSPAIEVDVLPKGLPSGTKEALTRLNESYQEIQRIKQKTDPIPYARYAVRNDLHAGVAVLTNAQTQGGRLYRAILELVLLKSGAVDADKVVKSWGQRRYELCDPHFPMLVQWVVYSYDLLQDTAVDLAIAFPKSQGEIEKFRQNIRQPPQVIDFLRAVGAGQGRDLCRR